MEQRIRCYFNCPSLCVEAEAGVEAEASVEAEAGVEAEASLEAEASVEIKACMEAEASVEAMVFHRSELRERVLM